jgi:hypothetical protein
MINPPSLPRCLRQPSSLWQTWLPRGLVVLLLAALDSGRHVAATAGEDLPLAKTSGADWADWPAWRGPAASGIRTEALPVTHWSARRSANSVVCGPDCVYASSNYPAMQMVCVRTDGQGDVTDSHLVWRHRSGCGKNLKTTVELAGKMVKCPQCGAAALVPQTKPSAILRGRHA